ncbi:MAG: hypothetical protein ABI767_13315 [Rhodanobacter sp.]
MAGSVSFVMAQTPPPPEPERPSAADRSAHRPDMGNHEGHGHAISHAGSFDHRNGSVIGDLRELEKLYMTAGRSRDLAAVYNDVLAKSRDPRVRDYAYHHLARLQARPANVDQAIRRSGIATLRKSLDESLANEAKMRTEHEKMLAA